MSILSNIAASVRPLLRLLFANRCRVCGEQLSLGQHFICTQCRYDMPTTNFCNQHYNPMAIRVQEIRPQIVHASSLIYYGGGWRKMIHRMKYHGEWRTAWQMGLWIGQELSRSPIYADVDLVVAVPLHPRRQLFRGYNQAQYIAEGIAHAMGIECSRRGIHRVRYNTSQVEIHRSERWRNVESLFKVTRPSHFSGRNIVVVDDVFTTGATMLSCAEALLDAVPDAKIYVTTLAISRYEFGIDVHAKPTPK